MNEILENAIQKRFDKAGPIIVKALEKRGFEAYYIKDEKDVANKVLELIPKSDSVSWGGSMTIDSLGLKSILKNNGYKLAAKYIYTFNKFLPIKQELESKKIGKKKYEKEHESELIAFNHAAESLEKMQIKSNVPYDKVINLTEEQDKKILAINNELDVIAKRLVDIKKAKEIATEITDEQHGKWKEPKFKDKNIDR